MRLLLDTCTMLWAATGDARLPESARALYLDPRNELLFSAVSVWEISVKYSLGKLPLPRPPASYLPQLRDRMGVNALPLSEAAACQVVKLPKMHADPFDRMLICQAIVEGCAILTPDPMIAQYPVNVLW